MSSWITAMNPTAPIGTEPDARKAAQSSAIAIIIGVVWGIINVGILYSSQATIKAAAISNAGGSAQAEAAAGGMITGALWASVAFVVIQAVLAFVQWRNPNKVIAILFLVLIALGAVSTLATLAMAGQMPQAAPTPIWQVIVGLLVLAVEAVLHVAGLRGIKTLDRLELEAAR